MGVTIHFQGRLLGPAEYQALCAGVREFASKNNWPTEEIPEERRVLQQVRDEKDWDYVGRTKGLIVHPHEKSEPLRFEFDEDLVIQEWCKTQFAGPGTHVLIVNTLRLIEPLFGTLKVEDEGEYWATQDASRLASHMKWVEEQIADLVSKRPSRRVAVRLPSQRIVDVLG